MSFSLVSLLFWFAGFETRAQNAMKSWVSVKSYSNSSFGCVYPTMLTLNEMSPSPLYYQMVPYALFHLSYHASCSPSYQNLFLTFVGIGSRVVNRIKFHFPVIECYNRVDNRIGNIAKIIGK